jgi:hypothetical protein
MINGSTKLESEIGAPRSQIAVNISGKKRASKAHKGEYVMTEKETELWNRIANFRFDQAGTEFTFAKRLAKENGWSAKFAGRVIDEYRKFVFLCCVSDGQISPSHFVDQAWHLHLTYTRSYWVDLCKNTLGRDLHHDPTRGGRAEREKFTGLYRDTFALYKRFFRAEPPRDIWPDRHDDRGSRETDRHRERNWTIRKQVLKSFRPQTTVAALAAVLILVTLGCSTDSPGFAIVIAVAMLAGVLYLATRNKRGGGSGSGCSSSGSGCGGGSDSSDSCGDSSGSCGDSGCSSGCGGGCGGGGD